MTPSRWAILIGHRPAGHRDVDPGPWQRVLAHGVSRGCRSCWSSRRSTRAARPPARDRTARSGCGPGRPFFITIGTSQASAAPASQQPGQDARPQPRIQVVDVGLQHDADLGVGGAARSARLPTTTRVTFGRPGVSRLPAPTPTASTVIDGRSSLRSQSVAISAMPVGVVSSPRPPPRTRQPRASSATAGTGTGISPCAVAHPAGAERDLARR